MSLKHAVTWAYCLFIASSLINPCFSVDSVALEKRQWPDVKKCEICVPVQFGKLEMLLPLDEIGKILVIGSQESALHILPQTNDPLEGVLFLTVEPENLVNKYRELGLLEGQSITTNEQFFDALGKPPIENNSFSKIRRVEQIDTANHYIKTSKNSLHVYWIQSSPPNSQYVYFVIDGEETVYMLSGNVTQKFYESALSNMRVTSVP